MTGESQKHLTFSGWYRSILDTDKTDANGALPDMNRTKIGPPDTEKDKKKILRMFKIGLKPTKEQRKVLNELILVSNRAYNLCLGLVHSKTCEAKVFDLDKVVSIWKDEEGKDGWFWKSSTVVRQYAAKSFCSAHKYILGRKIGQHEMTPKKYADINGIPPLAGVFGCAHKDVKLTPRSIRLLPRQFPKGQTEIKFTKSCKIGKIEHDFTVEKTPKGKFVLCVPVTDLNVMRRARAPSNSPSSSAKCAIDPGVRTFVTVYDPTNTECYQFGTTEEKRKRLTPITDKIDNWNSQNRTHLPKTTDEEKESWSRHMNRLWYKLQNQVNSLHREVIAYLVKTYNSVALGKLKVSGFRKGHTIQGKTINRWMRIYRHNDFRKKLLTRVEGDENIHVEVTDESYTSQTCGVCEVRNKHLGGKETFNCTSCGYVCHRDVNGARNIFRRAVGHF